MKKSLFVILLVFMLNIVISAEKKPEIFFNEFELSIKDYVMETFDITSQKSEGQVLFVFTNNENKFFRMELFSSVGKTVYTSFYDSDSNYWYIEKKAFFYDSPFDINNSEISISYFRYNDSIFKYNAEEKVYIEGLSIDTSPAVTDFRSVEDLIALNLDFIKKSESK